MADPLGTDDLQAINDSLGQLKKTSEILVRAEQAGLDVAEQRRRHDDLQQRLTGVKRAFFPNA